MPSINQTETPRKYWRSLAELEDRPEFRAFLEAEFPQAADPGGLNRRRWLQVMGASIALAGVAGCETDKQAVMPFATRPEGRTPGKPDQYATAMDLSGNAIGLVVTCYDGRPTKIEGNPLHPQSLGASHALAQSTILELYDPERSQNPLEQSTQDPIIHGGSGDQDKWAKFDGTLGQLMKTMRAERGAGFCVLTEASSSPTLARLQGQLIEQLPEAKWFEYEPLTDDHEREGARQAFGKPLRTQFELAKARVILCLDADLLASHGASLQYAREFSQGREVVDGKMNRLYVVESGYSVTGAAADHRLPLRSSQIAALAGQLQQAVERAVGGGDRGEHSGTHDSFAAKFLEAVAGDLAANRGASIVAVGPHQPPEVHAAVHQLNAALGNVGATVRYTRDANEARPGHVEAISTLAAEMKGGKVKTLLILGGNPVYDAPADVDFAAGLKSVATSIHLGLYRNETARLCQWHVPQAHFLESWGDARSYDGTYTVVQPMIAPLHAGRTSIELLARILGQPLPDPQELVKATFQAMVGDQFSERLWRQTVHDGLLADSAWASESVPTPPSVTLPTELKMEPPANGQLELVFYRDASVYDGRFANSGWLQECPDPLTKLTWDNAALISPATAKALKVTTESLVTLEVDGKRLQVPAYVMPGQADGSIALALGYGRTAAGYVGGLEEEEIEPVGVSAYPLRTGRTMYIAGGLKLEPNGGRFKLAATQDHHAIDTVGMKERARRVPTLVREAPLNEYLEHPEFAKHTVHHPPLESMWDEHTYEGHRWGMSIDLSKCIGCNACVVACQAENNIPVVGKEQIRRGREMHWIRVDRYFQGDADNSEDIEVALQPVACHHCELAPCEQVCPVAATVHSSEGLNDMVYNRCIGTRYCANNCPYKVRRFNYFNYHKDLEEANREISKMMYNPEVTVRSRGVMEKCTYCVQRIQATKIDRKNNGEPIPDGAIQTACQQACPSQAIVFGDLADESSQVAGCQKADRSYAMLAELNIKPRTAYLAKIRNLHPDLTAETGHAQHE